MTTDFSTSRRLYKSRTNRMIDGVCGGIAEYFGLDPVIVRVVWVVFTLMGGAGIILYIAAMIIMPTNREYLWNMPPSAGGAAPGYSGAGAQGAPGTAAPPFDPNYQPVRQIEHRRFWGIMLILVGALILLVKLADQFDFLEWMDWFDWSWEVVFPVIMIAVGAWIIMMYMRRDSGTPGAPGAAAENPDGTVNASWTDMPGSGSAGAASNAVGAGATADPFAPKRLTRSVMDRKLFGVCGGVAKYFGIDPTVVRVGYVLLVIASVGWGLLLYIILTFLLPEERYPEFR